MSGTINTIEIAKNDPSLRHRITETGRSFLRDKEDGWQGIRNRDMGLFILAVGLLADNPPRPERQKTSGKERS